MLLGPQPSQPVGLRRQLSPAAQLRPQSRPGEGGAGGGAGRTSRTGYGVTAGKRRAIPQGWAGGGAPSLAARTKHRSGGFTNTSRFLQREQSEWRVVTVAAAAAAAAALVPLPSCIKHHTAGRPSPPSPSTPTPLCPHCLFTSLFHSFFFPPLVLDLTFPRLWEF